MTPEQEKSFVMPLVRPVLKPTVNQNWWTCLKAILSPRKWCLEESYGLWAKQMGCYILAQAPFIFDFASTPQVVWPIIPPTGLLLVGSVFHDPGYKYGGLFIKTHLDDPWSFNAFSRDDLDDLLRDLTLQVNSIGDPPVPITTLANSAWAMVRTWGYITWNRYRQEDASVQKDFPKLYESGIVSGPLAMNC
jgi:hypothetical protein